MLPSGTRRLFLLVSWSCHDGSAWWMRVGEVVKHRCWLHPTRARFPECRQGPPLEDRGSPAISSNELPREPFATLPADLALPGRGPVPRRTLDCVAAQSVPPALWVIVDDGSTDETQSRRSTRADCLTCVWCGALIAAAGRWGRALSRPSTPAWRRCAWRTSASLSATSRPVCTPATSGRLRGGEPPAILRRTG